MLRIPVIAAVLFATLPAAICEAACTPKEATAQVASLPCHGAAPMPEPASNPAPPSHDADCPSCALDLVVSGAPTGAASAQAVAALTLPTPESASLALGAARHVRPERPPDRLHSPYARSNAPLLL